MSDRPFLKPEQVITSGDMSGNITSSVTILNQKTVCSYSYSWSGSSPVGTISIQGSNTYSLYSNGTVNNTGTDWTTLTLNVSGQPATSISVSGNTGTAAIDPIGPTGFYALRTVYTSASGTGSLQAYICSKVT